jgi:DNA-directed RNA polymerase specialized sigma24 family protein
VKPDSPKRILLAQPLCRQSGREGNGALPFKPSANRFAFPQAGFIIDGCGIPDSLQVNAMPSEESVSQWVGQLQDGDQAAAQKLWERYYRRLVGLARKKLQGLPRRAADEEDVALSAFNSFCQGAEKSRFPQLFDRDNLWRLLLTITARKAYQLRLHEGRQKRGGNALLDEAALAGPAGSDSSAQGLEQVIDREPTPAFAAQMAEQCQRLLECLPAEELRSVAQWKMEGYTNDEIAARLGCVVRSVERKLRLIRSFWGQGEPGP